MAEGVSRKKKSWNRKKLRRTVLIVCILCAVAVTVSACVAVMGLPEPIQAQLDIRPEKHAKRGSIYSRETKEVADDDFWVVLNQLPVVEEGKRDCNLQYENPSANHYSARISLYLKEDGSLLGNTTRVDPGYYVEQLALKQKLSQGEYPVMVRIELFENKIPAGEMSIDITLRVIKQQENQEDRSG